MVKDKLSEALASDSKEDFGYIMPAQSYNVRPEPLNSNLVAAKAAAEKELDSMPAVNFERTDIATSIPTATAFEIVAQELGMSVAALKQLGRQGRIAETQKRRTERGKSVRVEMSAAEKIITGELPPLLQPKRSRRRRPHKPSVLKEAKRIASQY